MLSRQRNWVMQMLNLRKGGLAVFVIAAMTGPCPSISVWSKPGTPSQTANSTQSQEIASASSKDIFDFNFFKSKVEPIFLKERPGHARCSACHSDPNRVFDLELLPEGATER